MALWWSSEQRKSLLRVQSAAVFCSINSVKLLNVYANVIHCFFNYWRSFGYKTSSGGVKSQKCECTKFWAGVSMHGKSTYLIYSYGGGTRLPNSLRAGPKWSRSTWGNRFLRLQRQRNAYIDRFSFLLPLAFLRNEKCPTSTLREKR